MSYLLLYTPSAAPPPPPPVTSPVMVGPSAVAISALTADVVVGELAAAVIVQAQFADLDVKGPVVYGWITPPPIASPPDAPGEVADTTSVGELEATELSADVVVNDLAADIVVKEGS